MFTGIVQCTAEIVSIRKKEDFFTYVVALPNHLIDGLETGASISQNGCCLTVTNIDSNFVTSDLMKETLRITNFSELTLKDSVNIERAAKFNDEIGGHVMSGHIATVAEITGIISSGNNYQLWLKLKNSLLMKYIFYKGFVGVDGVSLTVGETTKTHFCIHLIPETLKRTTLGKKKLGQYVNIEIDFHTQIIVDTVERFLTTKTLSQSHY